MENQTTYKKRPSVNVCTFSGNLGKDGELKVLQSGTSVVNTSLAITNYGEDETMWIALSIWGKQAENLAQYLKKGSHVCVTGPLIVGKYMDKDGVVQTSVKMTVKDLWFMPSASHSNDNDSNNSEEEQTTNDVSNTEDIPF